MHVALRSSDVLLKNVEVFYKWADRIAVLNRILEKTTFGEEFGEEKSGYGKCIKKVLVLTLWCLSSSR